MQKIIHTDTPIIPANNKKRKLHDLYGTIEEESPQKTIPRFKRFKKDSPFKMAFEDAASALDQFVYYSHVKPKETTIGFAKSKIHNSLTGPRVLNTTAKRVMQRDEEVLRYNEYEEMYYNSRRSSFIIMETPVARRLYNKRYSYSEKRTPQCKDMLSPNSGRRRSYGLNSAGFQLDLAIEKIRMRSPFLKDYVNMNIKSVKCTPTFRDASNEPNTRGNKDESRRESVEIYPKNLFNDFVETKSTNIELEKDEKRKAADELKKKIQDDELFEKQNRSFQEDGKYPSSIKKVRERRKRKSRIFPRQQPSDSDFFLSQSSVAADNNNKEEINTPLQPQNISQIYVVIDLEETPPSALKSSRRVEKEILGNSTVQNKNVLETNLIELSNKAIKTDRMLQFEELSNSHVQKIDKENLSPHVNAALDTLCSVNTLEKPKESLGSI